MEQERSPDLTVSEVEGASDDLHVLLLPLAAAWAVSMSTPQYLIGRCPPECYICIH